MIGKLRGWALAVVFLVGAAPAAAGCGAAPGYEETTPTQTGELAGLIISQPEARLIGTDGATLTFGIHVTVTNPNATDLTMRRVHGVLLLDQQQAAAIDIEGAEVVSGNSGRAFEFEVSVPAHLVLRVGARDYVGEGTVYADAGTGDGSLQSPFRFTGAVPR